MCGIRPRLTEYGRNRKLDREACGMRLFGGREGGQILNLMYVYEAHLIFIFTAHGTPRGCAAVAHTAHDRTIGLLDDALSFSESDFMIYPLPALNYTVFEHVMEVYG